MFYKKKYVNVKKKKKLEILNRLDKKTIEIRENISYNITWV